MSVTKFTLRSTCRPTEVGASVRLRRDRSTSSLPVSTILKKREGLLRYMLMSDNSQSHSAEPLCESYVFPITNFEYIIDTGRSTAQRFNVMLGRLGLCSQIVSELLSCTVAMSCSPVLYAAREHCNQVALQSDCRVSDNSAANRAWSGRIKQMKSKKANLFIDLAVTMLGLAHFGGLAKTGTPNS